MAATIDIADYLAQGGRLTHPANVPPRYRAELMKIMATFVDSSLAGAAGFADVINAGPGTKERAAAARIVQEKTANADTVLRLMGEFGADTGRYANHHPWTDRLPRDTPPGTTRSTHDMRLSVLNYPLAGWADAVVMNVCMGLGVCTQLEDLVRISYQPLADAFRAILPVEQRHADLAEKGLARLDRTEARASLRYWQPRVAAMFGPVPPARLAQLRAWGLRQATAEALRAEWSARLDTVLAQNDLDLTVGDTK